jgi:FkbM family methyltransferase
LKEGGAPKAIKQRAARDASPLRRATTESLNSGVHAVTMTSYAQNFEDVILARALGAIETGFYVDVGAWDPNIETVTRHFYEAGWRGINIEPIPKYHAMLETERPRDTNLCVAVGAENREATITLIEDSGMSTLDADVALKQAVHGFAQRQLQVRMMTLNAVFEAHAPADVHFLKIDCEGAEAEVINAFDLSRFRPWIILAESTAPSSRVETHGGLESHLLGHGYEFVYFDGLNRFYLAAEHEGLRPHFVLPPNVFDNFTVARFGGWKPGRPPMPVVKTCTEQFLDRLRSIAGSFGMGHR